MATLRNGNSLSTNFREDTIENDYNDACFSYFQTSWHLFLDFLTLQDKHNIRTFFVKKKLICARCETDQKGLLLYLFLKLLQKHCKFYIF
jgi:hypothetical protein